MIKRTEADDRFDELMSQGYYAAVTRKREGYHCALYNDVIKGVPHGAGDSILDALDSAVKNRDDMVQSGMYKK